MASGDGVSLTSSLLPADGPARELPKAQEEVERHLLSVLLQHQSGWAQNS